MPILHGAQQLRLRVTQLTWESEGVLSLCLQHPDRSELPAWLPGAHVDLTVPGPSGAPVTRQYSLSGSPADGSTWRVSVLREPVSTGGSEAVHTRVRPGDLVDVVGPRTTSRWRSRRPTCSSPGGSASPHSCR